VSWYPFTLGIWLNQPETVALGTQDKRLHSVLLMRYPTANLAREQLPKVERMLAQYNISPVLHIDDAENKHYRTSSLLMNYFGNLNMLAIAIGIIGLAVMLARMVVQRRRQLSALRAIGIPPRWLHLCIWMEGMILGTIGLTIGICVGAAFGYIIGINTFTQAGYQLIAYRLLEIFGVVILAAGGIAALSVKSVYRIPPTEATKYYE